MTSTGMMTGAIGGCLLGISAWLIYASQLPGGLAYEVFIQNTGNEFANLVGNLTSFLGGAILSVLVSCLTNRNMSSKTAEEQFDKTFEIDNPLNPWFHVYKEDLNLQGIGQFYHERPSFKVICKKYKPARITAYVAGK